MPSRDWVWRAWRSSGRVRAKTGIGIVTELMDTENADAVEEIADIIQIGAGTCRISAC